MIVDISNCSARGSNISSARGSNIIEGRVEVCEGNAFHSVCDDRWDLFEARVVCTQLNSATIGKSHSYKTLTGPVEPPNSVVAATNVRSHDYMAWWYCFPQL